MAYNAGTAFLQVVPSFAGVVTAIDAQAAEWGAQAGTTFKAAFQSQVQDLQIGVDPVINQTDVGAILSELDVVTADRTVQIDPSLSAGASAAYLAELSALLGFSTLAGAGAAGAAGGGAGGGGIVGMLLWGGGGIAGIGAGFGSIMSLAGFGLEHLVTTAIGLLGSFALAFGGAMALAAGALSIFGVGFITDLGGIGQAVGDIKTVYTAISTYQTMQQALAGQVNQSAAAQTALNTALAGFAPSARAAVLNAALVASQFHWMYDVATGPAEAVGANILAQLMKVGEDYLGDLGTFALRNMDIIQSSLQTLFTWLAGPGLANFTDLENLFTSRLPTAMAAFDQGVELFLNTLTFLANQTTGGFMQWLLGVFTYLNGPAGTAKLDSILTHMIADFHVWWDFFKQVFKTIVDIFSQSQGLGTGIIQTLTQMLKSLDDWLTGTGKNSVATLFLTHKEEVIELLKAIGDLIAAFGQFYLVVSPLFIRAATAALTALAGVFSLMAKNPISAYALALTLVAVKLGILTPLLAAFGVDLGALGAATGAAAAGLIGLDTSLPIGLALLANPVMWAAAAGVGALLAVNALKGAIQSTLAKYSTLDTVVAPAGIGKGFAANIDPALLKQMADNGNLMARAEYDAYEARLKALLKTGVSPGNSPWKNLLDQLGDFASGNVVTKSFEKLWQQITEGLQGIGSRIKNWFTSIPGDIGSWITGWGTPIKKWFMSIPGDILGWLKSWGTDIKNWFTDLPGTLGNVGNILLGIGKDLVGGLLKGIQDAWKTITGWIGTAIGDLSSVAKKVLGISSPSTVFYGIGQNIGQGLVNGLLESETVVTAAGRKMVSGLGLLSNSAIMASVGVSGAVSLTNPGSSSVLAALQRIETAVVQVPSATAAGISTKVDSRLVNVFQQQTRTALQVARAGG